MADSKEKLFSDFAPTTTEQWMDLSLIHISEPTRRS